MNKNNLLSTKGLVTSGIIAAIYVALTIIFAPISYGMIQFRISETLTVLPFFTPYAIPGLFIGVIISNFANPNGLFIIDIVIGSLSTLIAAYLTYKAKKKWHAIIPPIVVNAIAIGIMLYFLLGLVGQVPVYIPILWVFLGQTAVLLVFGYPFMILLEKYKEYIF